MEVKITNRKFWLYLISLVIVAVLSILGKDASAVIGLFSAYCVGNVATKFSQKKGTVVEDTRYI